VDKLHVKKPMETALYYRPQVLFIVLSSLSVYYSYAVVY